MKVNVAFEDELREEIEVEMQVPPCMGDEIFLWGDRSRGVPHAYEVLKVRHVVHLFGGSTTSHGLEITVTPKEELK